MAGSTDNRTKRSAPGHYRFDSFYVPIFRSSPVPEGTLWQIVWGIWKAFPMPHPVLLQCFPVQRSRDWCNRILCVFLCWLCTRCATIAAAGYAFTNVSVASATSTSDALNRGVQKFNKENIDHLHCSIRRRFLILFYLHVAFEPALLDAAASFFLRRLNWCRIKKVLLQFKCKWEYPIELEEEWEGININTWNLGGTTTIILPLRKCHQH